MNRKLNLIMRRDSCWIIILINCMRHLTTKTKYNCFNIIRSTKQSQSELRWHILFQNLWKITDPNSFIQNIFQLFYINYMQLILFCLFKFINSFRHVSQSLAVLEINSLKLVKITIFLFTYSFWLWDCVGFIRTWPYQKLL